MTNKKLLIVGPKFQNETSYEYTLQQLKSFGNNISNFYQRNSRGLLHIIPEEKIIDVPVVGSAHSVLGITSYIRQHYPGYDYHAIVSKFVHGDHAGTEFCYINNCLYQSGEHECGHLLGLNHANSWKEINNNWQLIPYQDGLSVMSAFASTCLSSPQYIYLGWTPDNEICKITNLDKPQTVTLKRISDFNNNDHFSIITIDKTLTKNGKIAYISYPQVTKSLGNQPCVALHIDYNSGAGSEKIKEITQYYFDQHFTGLNIKISSGDSNTVTVVIYK